MAKKTQQTRSIPAKKNAARTAPTAAVAASSKRRAQETAVQAVAAQAAEPANDEEEPQSGAALRVVESEPAVPVRWGNLRPGAREVLGLYEQRSGELCFPGVTFESLAAKAHRVDELAESVAKARLELAAAEAAQQAAEAEVVEATKRAFAYAQVYAQEHAELRAELEGFVYASPDKPRRKKREVQEGPGRGKQVADGEAAPAGDAED